MAKLLTAARDLCSEAGGAPNTGSGSLIDLVYCHIQDARQTLCVPNTRPTRSRNKSVLLNEPAEDRIST